MFSIRNGAGFLALSLAAASIVTPAHAFTSVKALKASKAKASVVDLVPGAAPITAGGFLNVRRLFDLYGDLITGLPQWSQVEQLIAAGFPNLATDVGEVGVVTNLEIDDPNVGGVITGNVNVMALLTMAQQMGLEFASSSYRGVNLFTSMLNRESVQVGFTEGNKTIISVDRNGEHLISKGVIETISGQASSFGTEKNVTLPSDYILDISLEMTQSLRDLTRYLGAMGNTLKLATFLQVSLTAEEATKDADVAVTVRMPSAATAEVLKAHFVVMISEFENQVPPSEREIVESIVVETSGNDVILTVTIKEEAMRRWAGQIGGKI